MTPSNAGKLGTIAVVALLLLGTATAQAQVHRNIWLYHRGAGSFAQANSPGQWVENTHLGTVYTFTELVRTRHYIEMYDASRVLWIRLYDDACYIRHSGTNGRYDLLYHGYWSR